MVRETALAVLNAILSEKDFLNDLDEKIGDGDHGSNMAGGVLAAKELLDELDGDDAKEILTAIGSAFAKNVGGTAGPLYGAALLEAAKIVDKNSALDVDTLEKIFGTAVETIQKRGGAQRGDKTMLDVLIPIHETFRAALNTDKPLDEILTEARDAARDGFDFAKTIAAKKGRAAALRKKSVGFDDPGAASSLLIFRTLCKVMRNA